MANNELSGALPTSFAKLRAMRYLNLNNNAISGTFPREYSRCINLEELYIEGNRIDFKASSKYFSS